MYSLILYSLLVHKLVFPLGDYLEAQEQQQINEYMQDTWTINTVPVRFEVIQCQGYYNFDTFCVFCFCVSLKINYEIYIYGLRTHPNYLQDVHCSNYVRTGSVFLAVSRMLGLHIITQIYETFCSITMYIQVPVRNVLFLTTTKSQSI